MFQSGNLRTNLHSFNIKLHNINHVSRGVVIKRWC